MNTQKSQWMTKTALVSFLIVLALMMGVLPFARVTDVEAAPPGYYTDQDNEDNAGTGSPDYDMGGLNAPLLGNTDATHPIEFRIQVDETPSGTWYFSTRAYDIDSPGEVDPVYLNGTFIGNLTGTGDSWAINNFDVTGLVVEGSNLIRIEVATGWVARIQFGVLNTAPLGTVYNLTVTPSGDGDGTVTSAPAGINCGTDCFEVYAENEVVTLTPVANPGSIFVGWSGDADCSDGVVTVTADLSCTAIFDDVMPTTTTVSSSPNPSVYGQALTFSAAVSAATTPNEGTVTFQIGGVDVPGCVDVPVVNGLATCNPGVLDVGTYAVTAVYSGTANYLSSSDDLDGGLTVQKANTSVAVDSTANPSMYGSLVTFGATVTADLPGAGIPVGTVSFYDGSTLLQTIPLDEYGRAEFTTVYPLAVGVHNIRAVYNGGDNFYGSASDVFEQRVEWATDLTIEKFIANPQLTSLDFIIVARNRSCCCISAPGAIVSDALLPYYYDATWTCEAAGGAKCGALSGEGSIYETLGAFPPGGVVTYTLHTNFELPDVGYIMNTAEIIPPVGVSDIDDTNNSVTITRWFLLLPIIFRNAIP